VNRGRGDLELVASHMQRAVARAEQHAAGAAVAGAAIVGGYSAPVGKVDLGHVDHGFIAQPAQRADGAGLIAAAERLDRMHAGAAGDARGALLHVRPQVQQIRRNVHGHRYREGCHRRNGYYHAQLAFDREVREPTKQ
jgi:hypothetical protein